MSNTENLPAPSFPVTRGSGMSPAIQIMLDDRLYERVKNIAGYMSKAEGFTPGHLIGKPEACFAVVTRSLTWKLDPFAVAQSTYSPAPGKVGFEGKLCQAIIENSGQVEGGVEYEAYGDWSAVQGKFEIKTNDKGKKYAVATYTDKDEAGLGVIARAQVIGEKKPREYKIDLRQAYPRNSTLWATDPLTQLKYRAARGLGNLAMPGIFMGVPFDREDMFEGHYGPDNAKDVTPPSANVIDNISAQIEAEKRQVTAEKPQADDAKGQADTPHDPETGEIIERPAADAVAAADAIEFDINAHRLDTQTGAKAAVKALCAVLARLPEEERGPVFLASGGQQVASVLGRLGLGMEKKRITDLGVKLVEEAAA